MPGSGRTARSPAIALIPARGRAPWHRHGTHGSLGFVFLVGAAAMFDLRLLGTARGIPVSDLAGHLLPWSRTGLALVGPTGLSMFVAHPIEWVGNPAFRVKLALIALAGVNAWLFHRGAFRSVGAWNRNTRAPGRARAAALVSLALWASVIACARLLAYR